MGGILWIERNVNRASPIHDQLVDPHQGCFSLFHTAISYCLDILVAITPSSSTQTLHDKPPLPNPTSTPLFRMTQTLTIEPSHL